MRRLFHPFTLVLTAILAAAYFYLAFSLSSSLWGRCALAFPFLCIWIVPFRYWGSEKAQQSSWDELLHLGAYISVGWLNFAFFLTLARDLVSLGLGFTGSESLRPWLKEPGSMIVFAASLLALALGLLFALRGPRVRKVSISIPGLDSALNGLRIVQISDLHASSIIKQGYVQRVVEQANRLEPDLVALTGDMVDGSVERLRETVAPLAELQPKERIFYVLGNHEYYSGPRSWVQHFRSLGFHALLNDFVELTVRGARIRISGVLDPAGRSLGPDEGPKPGQAAGPAPAPGEKLLRILLAHNPKLAPAAAPFGFDLQLSGHTHAGQFFPWNLAVSIIHAPHVSGLSRQGPMQVYVNPGTGSWGPPIRLGTQPELTLIELFSSDAQPGGSQG